MSGFEIPAGYESEEDFIFEMQEILPQAEIATITDALEVYGRMQLGII